MRLPVLIAADGAEWEAALVLALEQGEHSISIARRCVDVVELLAVATTGQAQAALIAADLPHLDADVIERLIVARVVPIGLISRDDVDTADRLRSIGVEYVVATDADPKVISSLVGEAVAAVGVDIAADASVSRGFSDTGISAARASRSDQFDGVAGAGLGAGPHGGLDSGPRRGVVIAVWGPVGAPGRTTVAVSVADEIARLGSSSLLVDADVYGGVIAQVLGLLDESAGLAAVSRQASAGRLDAAGLAASCWQVRPSFRVLTGIPRAQRWTELRPAAVSSVLSTARALADFVIVDCGFCLESDEELSFDTLAPRRNGATLAVLDAADVIVIVAGADPVGLQRLARGLVELRDAEVTATNWVVLNKVRGTVMAGNPTTELAAALRRFTGRVPAALLPLDQDAVDAALAAGQTLAEARPSSPLRRALVELAAALAGVEVPTPRRHRRRA